MERRLPCLVSTLLACAFAAPAHAATFTVNATADAADQNTADGACKTAANTCTVRAAVEQANALPGADVVSVPAGTYVLTVASPLTLSTGSTTISGAGASNTVIDAGGDTGVLTISGGVQALKSLTLRGSGGGAPGLAVSAGEFDAEAIAVRDNRATSAANVFGAGIAVSGGNVALRNSLIADNVGNSTFQFALGGGISITGASTTVSIVRTTITGNGLVAGGATTATYGAGIYSAANTSLRHVTLVGNAVTNTQNGASAGGNLYTNPAMGVPAVAIEDTVVAGGTALSGANCSGLAPVPSGRNLESGTDCGFIAPGIQNTAPKLTALGDHGGPIDTMTPTVGSALVDNAAGCGDRPTDLRGQLAPAGVACDIGAAELGSDRQLSLQASAATAAPGSTVTFVAKVTNGGLDASPGSTVGVVLSGGGTPELVVPSQGTCNGLSCDLGTIAASGSATVAIVVRVTGPGGVSALATTGGATPDPATGNDSQTVSVAGAAGPGGGGAGGGGGTGGNGGGGTQPPADTTPPKVTALKLKGKLRAGRAATVSFSLSEAATVKVTVKRGRSTLTTVTERVAAGARTVAIPAQRIKAGRLTFSVVATDAAGNRSKAAAVSARAGAAKRRR